MAFKSLKNFNEERFKNFFLLRDDGDSADVIFLYRSPDDALVADVHYIKSNEYTGYAHCCGRSCPACAKNIRVQNKLFIPLYNITSGEIEFWDRSTRFEPQLYSDIFSKYDNPSQVVFRIVRHGVAGDVNTTYQIIPIQHNTDPNTQYDAILARFQVSLPDYYSSICKEMSVSEMSNLFSSPARSNHMDPSDLPNYSVQPRTPKAKDVIPDPSAVNTYIPEEPPFDSGDSSEFDEIDSDNVTF